jgi:hypothetical protein
MEFSNLPKHRKEQLAQLTTGTSRIVLSLLMGLFGAGLIWSIDSALPPAQEFPEFSEVLPDVPWDYELFEGVDYANPATTEQVAYGRRLIMETADYLGPNSNMPFAGNNLDCNSCHLDGGTKPFAAPFVTVPSQFPQFRNRENKEGTIQERINGCMQRSMNGRPLPEDSEELAAMVAYMEWLSIDKPRGEKISGNKFLKVDYPDRAVDLNHGEKGTKRSAPHKVHSVRRLLEKPKLFPKKSMVNIIKAMSAPLMYHGQGCMIRSIVLLSKCYSIKVLRDIHNPLAQCPLFSWHRNLQQHLPYCGIHALSK